MGTLPSEDAVSALGLPTIPAGEREKQSGASSNPLAAILPLLTSLPVGQESQDTADHKPARYLVAKGLPTLPTKLVEKAWRMEFVDMEEFLKVPRALRLAEQGNPNQASLQESLVGALNEFQPIQQHQKSQRRALDVYTWTRCFTLYMAVVSKKVEGVIPEMVAHLHTVLKLHRKAPNSTAWLEYDIQFRMEMAAKEDKTWSCGDPWQYLSCLPGPGPAQDPFDMSGQPSQLPREPHLPTTVAPPLQQLQPATNSLGKRRQDNSKGKVPAGVGGAPKRPKKSGLCRLLNSAPGGCPYGNECIFVHRCTNCGVFNDHGQMSCPKPPKTSE